MSAALYSQQTQNAAVSLQDILDTFSAFQVEAAYKDVKNIQQFYDDTKYRNIVGRGANINAADLLPSKLQDVEFDLSISPSTSTPVYNAIMNDFLLRCCRRDRSISP